MKQSYTNVAFLQSIMLVLLLLTNFILSAQTTPELIFSNPVLKSGIANKQGAIYRFSNVATGVDAEVKLKKFSRPDITMADVDMSSFGWDKAFQPQFGLAGNVAANQNWYIDFELKFYKAGTTNTQKMARFDLTSLDVDGDGLSIAEYVVMENPATVNFSTVSYLINGGSGTQSFICPEDDITQTIEICDECDGSGMEDDDDDEQCEDCEGSGKVYAQCEHPWAASTLVQGPVLNFINIDTAATQVMSTYTYINKDKINFTIGARSSAAISNAGVRLNSMWYRSFSLAPQGGAVLPVRLMDFAATYDKKVVTLSWTTAQEKQFSHFTVQRSTDGKDFNDAGLVFSTGDAKDKKDYSLTDASIANMGGLMYYRLQMTDADKNISYSAIRIIRLGEQKQGMSIATYPNPAINELRVTIPSSWQAKQIKIELFNSSNGQKMKEVISQNGSQTEMISMSGLGRGIYLLKATCGSETAQQKILKN